MVDSSSADSQDFDYNRGQVVTPVQKKDSKMPLSAQS